jgi:hypothetical protein
MIRKTVLGVTAAAILAAVAGAVVTGAIAPTVASASHFVYASGNKPAYLKGGISKNCLSHQGECAHTVW